MGSDYDDFGRDLKRALRLISAAEEVLDGLSWRATASDYGKPRQGACCKRPASAEPVSSLVITLLTNGGSQVAANDENTLDLPPRLTDLLLFALSGQVGLDGLKSYRHYSDATGEKGLDCTPSALSNLVSALRNKLKGRGLDPDLLETRRHPSRMRFLARNVVVIHEVE